MGLDKNTVYLQISGSLRNFSTVISCRHLYRVHIGVEQKYGSLSALSADWANFSNMMECTPESGHCHSRCTLWTSPLSAVTGFKEGLQVCRDSKEIQFREHYLIIIETNMRHSRKRANGNMSPNFLTFMEPRNRFQGTKSACLCSLSVRYDNPIPYRFLAPIDCLKIPALKSYSGVGLYRLFFDFIYYNGEKIPTVCRTKECNFTFLFCTNLCHSLCIVFILPILKIVFPSRYKK